MMLAPLRRSALVLIILAASICLMWQLAAKSLWIDELVTTEIVRQPTAAVVIASVKATEGRPPLYYLLAHYWIGLAGHSDWSLRFFSVWAALPCLPLFYGLARRLTNDRVGLAAAALLAASPLYLLYSRMSRAYFLAVCLALASTYFMVRLLKQEMRWAWIGYLLTTLGLLYTDYMTASILLAQNLYLLIYSRRHRQLWLRWILAQIVLIAGFAPWLPSLLGQTSRYQSATTLADLSQGWLGYLVKLAQPALVFSLGETIFPWNPIALVALPVIGVLALMGAMAAWRRFRPMGLMAILSALVPVLFTVFIVTGFLVRYMTFAWIGARSLQALPFYLLLVAMGWFSIRPGAPRYLIAAVVGIGFVTADINYYRDREFHNPIYVVPSREIVKTVVNNAQPGDVVIAPRDSVFAHYYSNQQPALSLFESDVEALAFIRSRSSQRVWLVTVSRDRGRSLQPPELEMWLESRYRLAQHWGYAEQSPDYRHFKEALIQREAYQYKAELFLYTLRR
jgi:uncharacterized membrane protein